MIRTYFSNIPLFFNLFRRVVENDFKGFHKIIKDEFNDPGLFLDLACGTGHFSTKFSNDNYIGLDLNYRYLKNARKNHKKRFINSDATVISFKSEVFDNVFIVGLFHHLDDYTSLKVLKEIKRILKPGGKVLVVEDSKNFRTYNILGHLIHWLDIGEYIRDDEGYSRLWKNYFSIDKHYRMYSGLCDYEVFVLT